jgi:hypothetical protein
MSQSPADDAPEVFKRRSARAAYLDLRREGSPEVPPRLSRPLLVGAALSVARLKAVGLYRPDAAIRGLVFQRLLFDEVSQPAAGFRNLGVVAERD